MREPPASRGFGRFLQRTLTSETVLHAAGIVAFGFLASRLLGLLRTVAIAHAFGTDPQLGAYWVAFRLPDLVFQLLAGATLSQQAKEAKPDPAALAAAATGRAVGGGATKPGSAPAPKGKGKE